MGLLLFHNRGFQTSLSYVGEPIDNYRGIDVVDVEIECGE